MPRRNAELHTTVLVVQARHQEQGTTRLARNSEVEVCTDNFTTMAYINHQGGRDPDLTEIVRPLWEWALQTCITICATYIPGVDNDQADMLSRRKRVITDWMLPRNLFLFRLSLSPWMYSRQGLNTQLPRYVSRFPDPGAESVDAFSQKTHEGAGLR